MCLVRKCKIGFLIIFVIRVYIKQGYDIHSIQNQKIVVSLTIFEHNKYKL